jgi:hypothetical protein
MAPLDPYRTLGLQRGASLAEVKRAYRRLAKINHPDAAGPGALPRFLAIQAAYDQLANTNAPPVGRRPATQRSWDADPARTDATRRAYSRAGRGEGHREQGADGDSADDDRPRSRTRPAGTKPGGRPGSGPNRPGPDSARPGRDRGQRTERTDSTTQAARGKATLGSTSYDGAEPGPFEPDWGGASWYGTTSGTYWTLNPKEYADPRKHGPEYQARARRASGARPSIGDTTGPQNADRSREDPNPASTQWSSQEAAGRFHTIDDERLDSAPASENRRHGPDRRSADPWSSTATIDAQPFDLGAVATQVASVLTNPRTGGLRGRAVRALLGWLPIALGLAWIVGEASGCGRFAASCDPSVGPLTTAGQGIVLAVLFLVPEIAAIAAGAALVVVTAAVAASLILSATGSAADEASRRAALGALLVVAWLSGLAISIVRRLRIGPGSTRPVS